MSAELRRIAMVSMHTSPIAQPGQADSGGMNVAILALANELSKAGLSVDLLTRAVAEPEVIEISDNVTVRTLAAGPCGPLEKHELATVADEFGEAVAELAGRDDSGYNLIHAHYWLSGLATLPVAIELGLPFVQSFHTLGAMKNARMDAADSPEPESRLRGEAFLGSQADAVVASSAAEVTSLIDELLAPAERLWVVPPGVDAELFTPTRASNEPRLRRLLQLEPDRPLIVLAGRIQPLKGHELAVRALAGVRSLGRAAPLLVVAGEAAAGPESTASLLALATELGVAADVRFVGPLQRGTLADLFAAASLTLVPSHSETFGLVALESAAAGTPVIGYRSTGLMESVGDGVSGLLLDSREPAVWANVISDLLGDGARLARLQASARGHAERFSWEVASGLLLEVYESLRGED